MPKHPSATSRHFWKCQSLHLCLLAVLLLLAWLLHTSCVTAGRTLLGMGTRDWFLIAVGIPIAHQIFIWLAWRNELCYGSLTRWLGRRTFLVYQIVFHLFFWARPGVLAMLSIVDHDSMPLPMVWRLVLCILLALPTAWTGYSVARYFGVARASGADHFDEHYRHLPLVTEGIFKYTSNSMYTFAFLFFWMIAIAGASWQAFIAAAFSHTYIRVHYFCTERPDMQLIYGSEVTVAGA